jgi:L-alanine-DL-glutamate epimerase-like enolase superfamily enzyme
MAMLQLRHYSCELEFEHPFTTAKGTKTHQPTFIVSLGLAGMYGYGEAPANSYYNITTADMVASLESKRTMIERYALTDPQRFWHFLHHLIPGQHFLTAALDIAGWDLFAQMRRMPLYKLLGLTWPPTTITDYTIGIDEPAAMQHKLQQHPWPLYKIKCATPADVEKVALIRANTNARLRVDANEGWTIDDARKILPELVRLGVELVEQPLHRDAWEEMKELKAISPLPLIADESCKTEDEVKKCAEGFHGINIKLTKCGGITPALRMIKEARTLGMRVMMGSMSESTVGTAAVAHLLPLLDDADADGPLLLKEDVAEGLKYEEGKLLISGAPGLGIRFTGKRAANGFGG